MDSDPPILFYSTNSFKTAGTKLFPIDDVIPMGLAPDRGLFMPQRLPQFPPSFFTEAHNQSFTEVAHTLLRPFFVGSRYENQLEPMVETAFNFPIKTVNLPENIFLTHLDLGPTASFKDFGARFLAQFLGRHYQDSPHKFRILVATSGDTGSAVGHAFEQTPQAEVYILYPEGEVSPTQQKQLDRMGENVFALRIQGKFDDCQKIVNLHLILITPHISILTREAREILPQEIPLASFVQNMANACLISAAFAKNDYPLFARSLEDVIIEPARKQLIPGFEKVKANALKAQADGVAISGSGPTLFAITNADSSKARHIEDAMVRTFASLEITCDSHITRVDKLGTRIIE